MSTFFKQAQNCFPKPSEDEQVSSEIFLRATRELIPFFDVLGKSFRPVKSDVEGNVIKLENIRKSYPDKYPSLRSMIEEDIVKNNTKNGSGATMSLLWLKRALEFIFMFLNQIVEDHESGTCSENLVPFVKKSYETSLKPYHGWIVQKIFSVISHVAPWRKDFLQSLSLADNVSSNEVIQDMKEYISPLQVTLKAINCMYTELGLDFTDKV